MCVCLFVCVLVHLGVCVHIYLYVYVSVVCESLCFIGIVMVNSNYYVSLNKTKF